MRTPKPMSGILLPETDVARFWSKVDVRSGDECWLWKAGTNLNGYGRFSIGGEDFRAHRVSWLITTCTAPDGLGVLHACDTPACVRPDHLFIGSQEENIQDMDKKGRRVKKPCPGTANGRCRLSEEDVRLIRAASASGARTRAIAKQFGIGRTQVQRIVARQSWTHIDDGLIEAIAA